MQNRLLLSDQFPDRRPGGEVIGTVSTTGHKRLGIDCENVLSIDNSACRIAPLIQAGFGRASLAYGPFERSPGLAFAVSILNGHNTAQAEPLPDSFSSRVLQWFNGPGIDSKWRRFTILLSTKRLRRTLRQLRWWRHVSKQGVAAFRLDENLAVGWYGREIVANPVQQGHAFVMHALGPENGELWTVGTLSRTRAIRGVQNLPLYLVSILRPEGVVFYATSIEGSRGMAPYPLMQPIAVDFCQQSDELFFGLHQSVIGQIGFRLDTRVSGVKVAQVQGFDAWHGGACAADRLTGTGPLDGSCAEIGGRWLALEGGAQRTPTGLTCNTLRAVAVLDCSIPVGFIHAVVCGTVQTGKIGLIWRFHDLDNYWSAEIGPSRCEIVAARNGERTVLAAKTLVEDSDSTSHRIQVIDTGGHTIVQLDGEPICEGWLVCDPSESATRVGVRMDDLDQATSLSSFEAHPREIPIPDCLRLPAPWLRRGSKLIAADDFHGSSGDIDGRLTTSGELSWQRLIGSGTIELSGDGIAHVRATIEKPSPGRTAYGIMWSRPDFVDLEVTVTPPGTDRGQKHHCSSGLILFQDLKNYVICNFWRSDSYAGGSVSTFFRFDGFEDLYDAVWTNVGNRVFYGKPTTLRLCCDGSKYLVFLNEEPVLFRAFTDVYPDCQGLEIKRVGLVANWEWGFDTGSTFQHFKAFA